MELISRTVDDEVALIVEPISDKVLVMKVRINGITKACFDVCIVWDDLTTELAGLENPAQYLGVERRSYEAANIYRLSDEFVEKWRADNERKDSS